MTVKVDVRDGETIQQALHRLRREVQYAYQRKWHKTRIGSYDKPSYRRRRRQLLRQRNAAIHKRRPGHTLKMHVGLTALHLRQAPFTYQQKRKE